MKKWFYAFATMTLIFILASCQKDQAENQPEQESQNETVQEEDKDTAQNDSNENQDKNQSQNENEEQESEEMQEEETNSETNQTDSNQPTELSALNLKESLSLGMSAKKVKDLLGEPDQKVTGAKDGKPMWRYDLKTVEGYSYNAPSNRDDLDYESFINKDVQLIVFVGVENDQVYSYSIYYYDQEGVPKNYRKNKDYEKTDTMQ